jgi:hypothetical protein
MGTSEQSSRIVAPDPPEALGKIVVPLAEISDTWYRISPSRYPSPLFWSRLGRYRFDSEKARWGVCYAAQSITAAFQEVFGERIRHSGVLDWQELQLCVWAIRTPRSFRGINLFGETLTVIRATLQCFVSSYAKSQRWGAALMDHPADLDGLVYLGRQCGTECLAMFGDQKSPRRYQHRIRTGMLGNLSLWSGFWPMLDKLAVRIDSISGERDRHLEWNLETDFGKRHRPG